jgi:hypothetical protein
MKKITTKKISTTVTKLTIPTNKKGFIFIYEGGPIRGQHLLIT